MFGNGAGTSGKGNLIRAWFVAGLGSAMLSTALFRFATVTSPLTGTALLVCGYPGAKLRFSFLPFYALLAPKAVEFFLRGLGLCASRATYINHSQRQAVHTTWVIIVFFYK